jgi:hypothetical protein
LAYDHHSEIVCEDCHPSIPPEPTMADGADLIVGRTKAQVARVAACLDAQATKAKDPVGKATLAGREEELRRTLRDSPAEADVKSRIRALNTQASRTIDEEVRADFVGRVEGLQWGLGDDSCEIF